MEKKLFLLLTSVFLQTTQVIAGGYVTDDIYTCSSKQSQFELSIGATSKVALKGLQIGSCEGAGYVSGGNMHDCFGAARLFQSNSCAANFSLSWVGCFAPKKTFELKTISNFETKYTCVRTQKGGSYYMDGSRR